MSPRPRRLGDALGDALRSAEPLTPLAEIQREWEAAAGEAFARACRPQRLRQGELVVACESSVWAQELELSSPSVLARLNARIERSELRSLRPIVGEPGDR